MAKLENNDAFERMVLANLQRAIDFLRFAETKNAALLTLSSALSIALGSALLNEHLPQKMIWGLGIALVMTIAAGLCAIYTFLPRLHLPSFLGGRRAGPHPKNLLFFADIASYSIKEFKAAIEDRYGGTDAPKLKTEYLDDALVQLHVNSDIAAFKMRIFKYGAVIIAFAAAVVGITVVCWGAHSVAERL